jgi:hypothetical protein
MKRILLFLLLVIALIVPSSVSAHLGGVPYFKVNGDYTLAYPVQSASTDKIFFPQDLSSKNYIVNQPINFEFDVSLLPFSKDVLDKSRFDWDYGDGNKATGLTNVHTYTKPGSYFIVINVGDQNTSPQVIQSMIINILPNEDYKIPSVEVLVDGDKVSTESAKMHFSESYLFFNLAKSLTFSTKVVGESSSEVESYIWVFDNGQVLSGSPVSTKFDPAYYYSFPVLRIKDKNGFIYDQELRFENLDKTERPPVSKTVVGLGVVVFLGVLGAGVWFVRKGMAKRS